MRNPILILLIASALPAFTKPNDQPNGEQLYNTYCSACHAVDGKGATGGTFPPLAGSDWIAGSAKRTINIVLNGLHGPVKVRGKEYNLEMPPHGALLKDDEITKILNYVHSAWGNKGEKIPGDLVRTVRAEYHSRKESWTEPEILKLFPLEKRETVIKHLISRVYKGSWTSLPDFNSIKAENIEEEQEGFLDTNLAEMKEGFGIVWEGEFMAPQDGDYEFRLAADDGARVLFAGKVVVKTPEPSDTPLKNVVKGSVTLTKGTNPIRVEYFNAKGGHGLLLGWKTKGMKSEESLTPDQGAGFGKAPEIVLAPQGGKTVIYRNFINGVSPRAIGFGFPGEVNLVYSADLLAPALVWSGAFIDAGRHWYARGSGFQSPAEKKTFKLATESYLPKEAVFKGYSLDKAGNPTFLVMIGNSSLKDTWKPGSRKTLIRTLSLSGGKPLTIPLGDAAITGASKVTVSAGTPTTITYSLQ